MARRATVGFEAWGGIGLKNLEGTTGGGGTNAVIDTGNARPGGSVAALKFDSGAGNTTNFNVMDLGSPAITSAQTGYIRIFIRVSALPTTDSVLLTWRDSGSGANQVSVRLTSTGKIQLWNEVGAAQIGSDSAATVATNTYYGIELACKNTASNGYAEARLDGVSVANSSALTLTGGGLSDFRYGWVTAPGASKQIWVDDLIVNDSTGTAENFWANVTSSVFYLLPASDISRVGWTGGAGGTTNLFDAINNKPPVGVALASATDTSQIKDLANNTTDNYQMTMQSYATAGVPSNYRIIAVQALTEIGQDSATSTSFGVAITNPTIAETTHASLAVIAGTWPTNWFAFWSSAFVGDVIDRVTAPTITLRKNTASATITQMCDALYLALDAVFVPPIPPTLYTIQSNLRLGG